MLGVKFATNFLIYCVWWSCVSVVCVCLYTTPHASPGASKMLTLSSPPAIAGSEIPGTCLLHSVWHFVSAFSSGQHNIQIGLPFFSEFLSLNSHQASRVICEWKTVPDHFVDRCQSYLLNPQQICKGKKYLLECLENEMTFLEKEKNLMSPFIPSLL